MGTGDLGDRMKGYEHAETGRRFMPMLPVCVRIDGRSFSKWTKGLERPYDARLSTAMIETTITLVEQTQALIGYTQSDEISLLFHSDSHKRSIFFDGRISKMNSVLASVTTARFNALVANTIPEKSETPATFDCRAWQVPTAAEAANVFLWREQDAAKNSVSMAARAHYSHADLDGKSGSEMQQMLFEVGQNWNDYPAFFKRGTFVRRCAEERAFSTEELESLPPLHAARRDPSLTFTRHRIAAIDMPRFGTVVNRVQVLFSGEEPRTDSAG